MTFPSRPWLLVAPGVWIAVILAVFSAIVLRDSIFGRRVVTIGSNETAARACGIAVTKLKIVTYTLAGATFGLAGVMQMSRLRQGDPTVAAAKNWTSLRQSSLTAAASAEAKAVISGSMIGAAIMSFLRNGCQQVGWPNYIQEIIIGAIIVAAVAAEAASRRRRL